MQSHSRLPHWQPEGAAYFLTWRLAGSLPVTVLADCWTSEGEKFVAGDRLLDAAATGPRWLQEPEIAQCVIKAFLEGNRIGRYELGAWVVMPNHVHVILHPKIALPNIISGIKASSARDANRLLRRAGEIFWAKDYFDRWIRNGDEEQRIIHYIERNPVKAGLCSSPEDWPWSSATGHAASAAFAPEARRG